MRHGIIYTSRKRASTEAYVAHIRNEFVWILGSQHSSRFGQIFYTYHRHPHNVESIWCLVWRSLGIIHSIPNRSCTLLLCDFIHVQLRYSCTDLHTIPTFYRWRYHVTHSFHSTIDPRDLISWWYSKVGLLRNSILLCHSRYRVFSFRKHVSKS